MSPRLSRPSARRLSSSDSTRKSSTASSVEFSRPPVRTMEPVSPLHSRAKGSKEGSRGSRSVSDHEPSNADSSPDHLSLDSARSELSDAEGLVLSLPPSQSFRFNHVPRPDSPLNKLNLPSKKTPRSQKGSGRSECSSQGGMGPQRADHRRASQASSGLHSVQDLHSYRSDDSLSVPGGRTGSSLAATARRRMSLVSVGSSVDEAIDDMLANTNVLCPDELRKCFPEMFSLFDDDNTGKISLRSLGTIMRALGQRVTDAELWQLFEEVVIMKREEFEAEQNKLVPRTIRKLRQLWSRIRPANAYVVDGTRDSLRSAAEDLQKLGVCSTGVDNVPEAEETVDAPNERESTKRLRKEVVTEEEALEMLLNRAAFETKMSTVVTSDDFRYMFGVFDRDGSGSLTADEMIHVMTSYGEPLTEEEVNDLMRLVDADGDGQVVFEELSDLLVQSIQPIDLSRPPYTPENSARPNQPKAPKLSSLAMSTE
eukprot:Rmarinus@m.287